jgi:A/G-specific adenine glycosylase
MDSKRSENQVFSSQIIKWYRENPRDLPWRNCSDPYKIWLSEIILQQTRVAQGLPYYYAFCESYPTVKDLALAPESEVLRLWQGLGYYSRARNLHFCAKYVWNELNGVFPNTYADLIRLKGVGSYTAAAISSFAFGEAKAVVDGNVFRVLSRYFGIETDIASSRGKKEFENLANQLIPEDNPGEFNQAMMDFGSRLCTPKKSFCQNCPVNASCFAYSHSLVNVLPVKINKVKIKERSLNYLVIRCGQEWVWKKRGPGDIWEGLFDFPSEDFSKKEILSASTPKTYPKKYRHLLSHQKLEAEFSEVEIPVTERKKLAQWCEEEGFNLVSENEIEYLAKPKLIVNFLSDRGF